MIRYNGKDYEIRAITVCLNGKPTVVLVAKLELWGAIESGAFGNSAERKIDDLICYYCNEEEWEMSDEELAKVLENL